MSCGGKGYTETNNDPATRRPCVCSQCLKNREKRRTEDLSILQRLERMAEIAKHRNEPGKTYRCSECRDTLYTIRKGRSAKFGIPCEGAVKCQGGQCPAWRHERRMAESTKTPRIVAIDDKDTSDIPF